MAPGNSRHQLDRMASRFSLFKMDKPTLSGLKLALIDPEMRVRLQDDERPSQIDTIVGMWVTGGFLNGQRFRFNENVNCFIGDTGAGKSLAIELIRFCLDQIPRVTKIQKEVGSLLTEQFGNLSTVHLFVKKGNTYYLVERIWGNPPTAPVVQRVSPTGLEQMQGVLDLKSFFPIKAFSQSEIIEFAREPEVRLSLTDDLIDSSVETSTIKDLKVSLRENASSVCTEQAKQINIQKELTELPNLVESRTQLDKTLNDPKIGEHQIWYKEQSILQQAQGQFTEVDRKLESNITNITVSSSLPKDLETFPNKDLMEELKSLYDGWQKQVADSKQNMKANLAALLEKIGGLTGRWTTRFSKAEEEYRNLLAIIDKDGIGLQALSERRQRIEAQISDLEKRKTELDNEIVPQIEKLQAEREVLLTKLQTNRRAITAKREAKASELSEKLDNLVRLHVHARSNISQFRSALQLIAQGSRLQATDLDNLAKGHPISIVKNLLGNNFETLSTETQVDQAKLSRLWETIIDRKRLDDLYELQLTDVEDVIEVMLNVEKGEYKTIETLAHGQKCMVILMIALAEGNTPLLVDQPEDALHAPGIEQGIVSTLRSRRGGRQCIFATRNANILVSADAEQILALKADAHHGELSGCGSLDGFDNRHLVIYHVEGGEDAFNRKLTIYRLQPTS
jgi:hypothetical protein